MAARYFLNIGTNWGDTANWSDTSGGAGGFSVPTNADDVFFDGNSGPCDINTTTRDCLTIDFTGYINTITFTQSLRVYGNVTLDPTMSFAGAGSLLIMATSTITTNTKTLDVNFQPSVAGIITLADTLTITANMTFGAITIINGSDIYLEGNLTSNQNLASLTPTSKIIFSGGNNQTWNGASWLSNSIDINKSGGTLFLTGTIYYTTGSFTYINGTVETSGSTMVFSTCVLDSKGDSGPTTPSTLSSSGINWYNFQQAHLANITLLSDLTVTNSFVAGGTNILNGFNLNIYGSFSAGAFFSNISGTVTLNFLGEQDAVLNGTNIYLSVNFNKTGKLSFTSESTWVLGFNGKTITYIQGAIDTLKSSILLYSSICDFGNSLYTKNTYNENGITFWNLSCNDQAQPTFTYDVRVINNFSVTRNVLNGGVNIYIGNLTPTTNPILHGTSGGNCKIIFDGDGTHYWGGQGYIYNDIEINMTGTLYIGNVGLYSLVGTPTTFNYVKGNVIGLNNSILTIYGSGGIFRGRIDKISNLKNIRFSVNSYTMSTDYFFNGSATVQTTIEPRSNLNTFLTINLTKEGECLSKFLKLKNVVMATGQEGRLRITTPGGNKGGNRGIIFGDQQCNGFSKNSPMITKEPMFGKLLADPMIVR